MNFKPQNLYISVIDLFSIFIPGGIAAIVIYHNFGDAISETLVIDETKTEYTWAILLLYSYLLGHVLFRIGSQLDDPLYDNWKVGKLKEYLKGKLLFWSKKEKDNSDASMVKYLPEILEIRKKYDASEIESSYDWSYYYLLNAGSIGIDDVNRKMADSKFFRSLFIISIGLIVLYPLKLILIGHILKFSILTALSLVLSWFSCWSYFELRLKATKILYKHVIFLEAMKEIEFQEKIN